MAVYKVLQDIEGEDKLIAWLTPKQTIYAAIVIVCGIVGFFLGRANIALAVPFIFPILIFGFLAAPLGRDQPNDIWLAAQLRFFVKSRKRIWDQSGMQELVHITVPKKIERIYTDGLAQDEVRSRLRALSTTIDSRGWAVKNAAINTYSAPQFSMQFQQAGDDRLVAGDSLPMEVPISDVTASDDILDAQNNIVAQRFDQQIKQQQQLHKEALRSSMANGGPVNAQAQTGQQNIPDDFYFLREQQAQANATTQAAPQLATFAPQVVAPAQAGVVPQSNSFTATAATQTPADDTDPSAQALLEKIHKDKELEHNIATHSHERVIKTREEIEEEERIAAARLAEQKRIAAMEERKRIEAERLAKREATRTAPNAIIRELSRDSDLKVSTLATQAKRAVQTTDDGEVVISLH